MKERESGILMHISSLPGPYGIGDFGKGAYEFVDFLEVAKQKVWQILPLGTTGFGDSPYQSFSDSCEVFWNALLPSLPHLICTF